MSSATDQALMGPQVDPAMCHAVCMAVDRALSMCDVRVRSIALSSVPFHEPNNVTGLIGVHGKVSGFLTVNLSERFAMKAVGGLLQDTFAELTAQVVDGVGEMTNIIAGSVKRDLAGTPWAYSHLTVPSVIVGSGYRIAYAKGLTFICVVFEHDDRESIVINDRLLQVSLSLLRL